MLVGWRLMRCDRMTIRFMVIVTGLPIGLLYVTEQSYFTWDIKNAIRCEV